MFTPREIVIDPTQIKPGSVEEKYLRKVIDQNDGRPENTFKLTKSRGQDRDGRARNKHGYWADIDNVHLKDFSLIRFPNSDRYYVIGRQLGEGGIGKVKLLPIYFTKSPNGGLTRHEDPDKEEIIKIIRGGGKKAQEAREEAELAREAGGVEAVSGFNTEGNRSGYTKLDKASGMDIENYLQTHPDMTFQERVQMIRMIMEEFTKNSRERLLLCRY